MTADWPTTPAVPRRRLGPRLAIVFLVALVAAGGYVWRCRVSTYHLGTVEPGGLYRDGNQSPCQFETAVRKVQPRTGIRLVHENEGADRDKPQFESEREFLDVKG